MLPNITLKVIDLNKSTIGNEKFYCGLMEIHEVPDNLSDEANVRSQNETNTVSKKIKILINFLRKIIFFN